MPRRFFAEEAYGVFRAADVEWLGMTGVGEADIAGGDIDHHVKGGDEHGSRQGFEKMVEPTVEFTEKNAGVGSDGLNFLDEDALHGGDERGVDAVAHDVANEHGSLRVGNLVDGEKVAADAAFGEVAVGEL